MKCWGEGDGCYGRVNARGSLWALCGINTHWALLSQPRFQGNKSPSFLPRAQNWVFPFLPPHQCWAPQLGSSWGKKGSHPGTGMEAGEQSSGCPP